MAPPEWKLEPDNKTVTAVFATTPPLTLQFTTAEVEGMLKDLGKARANMEPEVPDSYEIVEDEEPINDPLWETTPGQSGQSALLHVCDPRFGWLHYEIPRDEARRLGGFLRGIARFDKG